MDVTRCQYQGVYDVTSCLVPSPFQEGVVSVRRGVSIRRGWSLTGGLCQGGSVKRGDSVRRGFLSGGGLCQEEGSLCQEGMVSVRRGWSLSERGQTDTCENITFPCSCQILKHIKPGARTARTNLIY